MSFDILRYVEIKSQEVAWYLLENQRQYNILYKRSCRHSTEVCDNNTVDTHTVWKKHRTLFYNHYFFLSFRYIIYYLQDTE